MHILDYNQRNPRGRGEAGEGRGERVKKDYCCVSGDRVSHDVTKYCKMLKHENVDKLKMDGWVHDALSVAPVSVCLQTFWS